MNESEELRLWTAAVQGSPGGNVPWSHFFIRPDVLHYDDDGNVPGPHHTQSAAVDSNLYGHHVQYGRVTLEKMSEWRGSVPGIFLKPNLLGNGERKDNQERRDGDGELAVSVPVSGGCNTWVMGHCCDHCNRNTKQWDGDAGRERGSGEISCARVGG